MLDAPKLAFGGLVLLISLVAIFPDHIIPSVKWLGRQVGLFDDKTYTVPAQRARRDAPRSGQGMPSGKSGGMTYRVSGDAGYRVGSEQSGWSNTGGQSDFLMGDALDNAMNDQINSTLPDDYYADAFVDEDDKTKNERPKRAQGPAAPPGNGRFRELTLEDVVDQGVEELQKRADRVMRGDIFSPITTNNRKSAEASAGGPVMSDEELKRLLEKSKPLTVGNTSSSASAAAGISTGPAQQTLRGRNAQ